MRGSAIEVSAVPDCSVSKLALATRDDNGNEEQVIEMGILKTFLFWNHFEWIKWVEYERVTEKLLTVSSSSQGGFEDGESDIVGRRALRPSESCEAVRPITGHKADS